jgi:hypothetical protein
MPAWGLVPDSPWIYAAQRLGRGAARQFRAPKLGGGGLKVGFSFYTARVIIYKPVLNLELRAEYGMVGRYLHKIGKRIERGAKRQAHFKTGALKKSIRLEHINFREGAAIKVGSSLPYAYAHHEGTKPHIITPNPPNNVLVFAKGSRIIRTQVVHHPGTKPNRYLSDQLRIHIRG